MIRLNKINISFENREIIKNSGLSIENGKVTAIIGESGSGKTTLLYSLGLISSQNEYEYIFDEIKINLKSDKEKSLLRKNKIGYVFQDNNLFENLSIYDNIVLSAEVSNQNISENDVKYLLEYVHLNQIDYNAIVNKLSGGERQRLAIACVLAKKPKLIIADEPTSSLDSNNSELIIEILSKIAHHENSMVVIATHSKDTYDKADVIYQIKAHKIQLLKPENANDVEAINKKEMTTCKKNKREFYSKTRFNFFSDYVLKKLKTNKFSRNMMAIMCALSVSLCSCAFSFGTSFVDQQKTNMSRISNREIFVTNLTVPGISDINYEENLIMTKTEQESLKKCSDIDKSYYFVELKSTGFDYKSGAGITDSNMTVNGKETVKFSSTNSPSSGKQQYTIIPYYPEQNMQDRTEYTFQSEENKSGDKIYISNTLAKLIGASSDMKTLNLGATVRVPEFCYKTIMNSYADDKTIKYDIDVDMTDSYSDSLSIAGVLKNDVTNIYSDSGNCVIYMPYEKVMQIVKEYQQKYSYNGSLYSYEWEPSAMMVYAKDFSVIENCIQSIEKINTNYVCVNQYQDISTMNNSIHSLKNVISTFSIILLFIVIVLMSIIYINRIRGRRYEFAILKANGLMKFEINKLLFLETGFEVIKSIIISIAFAFILMKVSNVLVGEGMIVLNIKTILKIVLISIISINIPTFLGILKINKYSPDKIMRN